MTEQQAQAKALKQPESKGDVKLAAQLASTKTTSSVTASLAGLDDDSKLPLGELVKLSVGGVKFMTTVGTLTAQGRATNFFTGLLSGRMGSTKDGDAYFIDREGEYFGLLLRWMRCGKSLNMPSTRHTHWPSTMLQLAVFVVVDQARFQRCRRSATPSAKRPTSTTWTL